MYAPRVFVSMIGALAVFAVATYWLTGSLSTTLIETLICAVLIQIGYFGGVLFLIWRARVSKSATSSTSGAGIQSGLTDKPAGELPSFKRSEPFNS
jgi:exopolysaccharide production repressor protein